MRNWRTMAVFLGPRHTMAEDRDGRSSARDMACKEPICLPSLSSWLVAFAVFSAGGWAVWPFLATEGSSIDGGNAASLSCGRASESGGAGMGGSSCEGWTWHGSQPPGAWVIFASSRPRRRGIEGPVRSMSRMPTEWPARDSESAIWVVMEDLPTPPLPERT